MGEAGAGLAAGVVSARGKGWLPDRKFFATLAKSRYAGPICQHHEYDLGKTPAEMVVHFKRDLQTLRDWLSEAGS